MIDFHCRDVPGNVRLRMHRSTALPADGGGQCPRNIHDHNTGLIRSTFNVQAPPKIRGGKGAGKGGAAVGFIIFATPDHATISQLKVLLEEIDDPRHPVVVHLDAKQPQRVKEAIASIAPRSHLRMISTRNITWGGFSLIQAELDCLRELRRMPQPWDFVVDISANGFPIKPKRVYRKQLDAMGDVNHLEIFYQLDNFLDARGLRYWFVECPDVHRVYRLENAGSSTDQRPLPQGIDIYAGSQWFVLARSFVDFVMDCLEKREKGDEERCTMVRDFYEYCRRVDLTDATQSGHPMACEMVPSWSDCYSDSSAWCAWQVLHSERRNVFPDDHHE